MNSVKTAYQEQVTHLFRLQKYGIKFGLSKTLNLLKAFGDPHIGQTYVHIAGTNGKGSVAAFVARILKEAGFRVGLYSSPHLVRFTERFRVSDREIGQEKATALIRELREAFSEKEPPTFFEATTAMALIHFAREHADISVIEVGMGGRLDATNVIRPLVSVITNISMEHQFFLGSRLLDIAKEKGGIIKEGIDVLTAASQPPVLDLFRKICREKDAPFWRVGKDVLYRTTNSGFHYYGLNRRLKGLNLGLIGLFQARNAALAVAAIERLEQKGFAVSPEDIRKGLSSTLWPGRMHLFGKAPGILLDGAHNPAAIRVLARSIRAGFQYRKMILVIGIMQDKDIGQLLRVIVPLASYVIYTRPAYYRAAEPEILMREAASLEIPGEVSWTVGAALDRAREMAHTEDLILVCGSLFTVGEALIYLDPGLYRTDDVR
jgi:dihydrofolate synthase/folylpolyglutamate synthase